MHLLVINRETGEVEANIKTIKQHDLWRKYLLQHNDVKMGIKVFCGETNQTPEQLLKEFSLTDIANILSTRYMIRNYEENNNRFEFKNKRKAVR